MHQLSHALNQSGIDCTMAYFGTHNRVRFETDRMICEPAGDRASMAYYADYGPRVAHEIVLDRETLLVVPEAVPVPRGATAACGVAIWWLSIDNAFPGKPELRDQPQRAAFLQTPGLIHLYQSEYARQWLVEGGAEQVYALSDYTARLFTEAPAAAPAASAKASFNAQKGVVEAQEFFARRPGYDALALKGYTKLALRNIFAERALYVDFGHFPGKDRMPREAAVSGSIVFVNRAGAGAFGEDFPLPDPFKFTSGEIGEALDARLLAALADPRRHWDMQAPFRAAILDERTRFFAEVRRLWGG